MGKEVFRVVRQEDPEDAGLHHPAVVSVQSTHGLGGNFKRYPPGLSGLQRNPSERRQGVLRLHRGADQVPQIQLGTEVPGTAPVLVTVKDAVTDSPGVISLADRDSSP